MNKFVLNVREIWMKERHVNEMEGNHDSLSKMSSKSGPWLGWSNEDVCVKCARNVDEGKTCK